MRATITNTGTVAAARVDDAFKLDGTAMPGSPVATGGIPAGGSVTGRAPVGYPRPEGRARHRRRPPTPASAVAESDEGNNTATLTVTVKGNKVDQRRLRAGQRSRHRAGGLERLSTGAGTTSYSDAGGTDGSRGRRSPASGKSVLFGMPTWTSAPIAVTPASAEPAVSVSRRPGSPRRRPSGSPTSAPPASCCSTVRLIEVPLATTGFTTLEQPVTLPPGVAQVRVVLFGFAPTDTRTAGTVTFDDVGLFGP